jgi:hypothetical protein
MLTRPDFLMKKICAAVNSHCVYSPTETMTNHPAFPTTDIDHTLRMQVINQPVPHGRNISVRIPVHISRSRRDIASEMCGHTRLQLKRETPLGFSMRYVTGH